MGGSKGGSSRLSVVSAALPRSISFGGIASESGGASARARLGAERATRRSGAAMWELAKEPDQKLRRGTLKVADDAGGARKS